MNDVFSYYTEGMLKVNNNKMMLFITTLFGLIALTGCIITINPTERKDWVEKRTANHFEAHFSYFDGEYDLPIYLKRGQTVKVYEKWDTHPVKEPKWDAAIGDGWRDPDNQPFLTDADRERCEEAGCVTFTAQKTGNYTLQLLSWNEGGSVEVYWTIK